MKKYINECDKECYSGVKLDDAFSPELFHMPKRQFETDVSHALHTNLGSITTVDRMTGFGWRDIESGFRDVDGNFWLATCGVDVMNSGSKTIGEAIEFIKSRANTCIPDEVAK